ncbi:WSC domain-containing protein [Chaetomidium leptoderma]|uniref:WSC domain-containing protein n=1 Tax=Chaetomidium leptoderma TaxID=669021 RepID=A0AAN6VTH2_9PEZI|nr:WSC domain-containing protein [Chaetomidium leptoderma]
MRLSVGQALAAAAGLLSVVDAQGYYGSVSAELSACGSDNFINLGCFPGFEVAAGFGFFKFNPQGYNPSDPSRSFPGWDPGSQFNNTVTPLDCARVCRAYGYKFTALRDNSCSCGIQLPAGYSPDGVAVCDVACGGDSTQTCGGGSSAQIYVDPTFAANDQVPIVASNPAIASYYEYLGCYNAPGGFPTTDGRASVLVADIDACFNLCAGMGYPLLHGAPDNGQVRCICGTAFGLGAYRVHPQLLPTPGVCNTTCSAPDGIFGDCDISTDRCCGANNVYPIYINTQLQGCYTPRIPGYKTNPSDPVYECDAISDTLTGPPTVLDLPEYDPSLILHGHTALIRMPVVAVPRGRTYYLNGCYGRTILDVVDSLVSYHVPTATFTPATLDHCAALCDNLEYNIFSVLNGK